MESENCITRKLKHKPTVVEALQWVDNIHDMKHFCGKDCTITFEYADGLDYYYLLTIYDSILDKNVSVSYGDYVVKNDEGNFARMSAYYLNKYYEDEK